MIPATPEPKIPENGPEPEFRPEFFRNFEPSQLLNNEQQNQYHPMIVHPQRYPHQLFPMQGFYLILYTTIAIKSVHTQTSIWRFLTTPQSS
jgi:hypothetical protein